MFFLKYRKNFFLPNYSRIIDKKISHQNVM